MFVPTVEPRARLCRAELEQQLRLFLGRRRLGKRSPEENSRALGRACPGCGPRRRDDVLHDPGLAPRLAREQMLGYGVVCGGPSRKEPRRLVVGLCSLDPRHVCVQTTAEDWMCERKRLPAAEDPGRHQLCVGRCAVGLIEAGKPSGRGQIALLKHRQRLCETTGVRGQLAQLQADRTTADAHTDSLDVCGRLGRRRYPLLEQVLDNATHEQGRPAGRIHDRVQEHRIGQLTEASLEQVGR